MRRVAVEVLSYIQDVYVISFVVAGGFRHCAGSGVERHNSRRTTILLEVVFVWRQCASILCVRLCVTACVCQGAYNMKTVILCL